jgi:hypothetical protein
VFDSLSRPSFFFPAPKCVLLPRQVAQYIEERVLEDSCYVNIKLDHERIRLLKVRGMFVSAPVA